ncbi:hypothetical protein [Legionella jamestowniensis]|uniref:Uncharacterized protein n=1 Tax=Legionella jamestowniensis TaxID=455 RepID=A0A0W0UJ95_9GAMM|nr:hypothetical protein [Legionella jamestowniensis]KTD07693.1 hypothetical protein Ljam_1888 [Legionella jamestowniensis]OCH99432.1 hypothetical protein A8135_07045 [Legionella jamestowniensis]SFL60748.1 hypothetical protein SAMN02746073_1007 [Legionella jamestowniensis DSM 19215]
MSEKQQRTATSTREKMLNRYGDGLHHKHNKNHQPYRKHCRSHPAQLNGHTPQNEENENTSTGLVRAFKLRKMRKRLDKGRFH